MVLLPSIDPNFSDRHIKLDTLVRLRWLAIFGQASAILFVWLGLGYEFDGFSCLALVGLSAWLNLYLQLHFNSNFRLKSLSATLLLAYDSFQLAGLLYLTGGLQNPFALLLLVPAVVSATTQIARYTAFLALLIAVLATSLIWFYQPLPWANATPPDLPLLYVLGIWVAIVLTMLFLSIYTFRLAQERHLLANALSATELILANEQHLSSLDGLATAAAHELGTPLATITLVAKELEQGLFDDDPIKEDIELLRNQSERCREILGKLRSLSSDEDSTFTKMRLKALIAEIAAPYEDYGIEIAKNFPQDITNQPVLWRNPGILYGLSNLIENAVDFARDRVDITAKWTDTHLSLRIMDDGPGFSEAILHRLGDPYVTTRSLKENSNAQEGGNGAPRIGRGGGLGLGFFIAKTLLERSGARVRISNRKDSPDAKPEPKNQKNARKISGAVIDIHWQRSQLEADQ